MGGKIRFEVTNASEESKKEDNTNAQHKRELCKRRHWNVIGNEPTISQSTLPLNAIDECSSSHNSRSPGTPSWNRKACNEGLNTSVYSVNELAASANDDISSSRMLDHDQSTTALVLTRMDHLPHKDFAAEIRASLDIETFIKEAIMLLDLDCTDLTEILDKMLDAMFSQSVKSQVDPTATLLTNAATEADSPGDTDERAIWSGVQTASISSVFSTHHSTLTTLANVAKGHFHKPNLSDLITEAKEALLFEVCFQDLKYQRLAKTIKGISVVDDERLSTDQSWICAMCSLSHIHKRYLGMARLCSPVNLGRSNEGTCLIVLVITPTKEKGTKSDIEISRTFATILSDPEFRSALMYAADENEVKSLLWSQAQELSSEACRQRRRSSNIAQTAQAVMASKASARIGGGIYEDLQRRLPHYWSDIKEGIYGKNTIRKTISTTFFLYFACILPMIAFGVLNSNNTDGKIGVTRMIVSQTIGGLCCGFFGGQPLIVLLFTAPLALYIKIVHSIATSYEINFYAIYGCVGLCNSLLLIVYSLAGFSRWMRWSTRSTEEIFALFVSVAFIVDAAKDSHKTFSTYYTCPSGSIVSSANTSSMSTRNSTNPATQSRLNTTFAHNPVNLTPASHSKLAVGCEREVALLHLLLLLGTVLLAVSLFNFTKTPFLTACKREILTDFALPIAVISMSLIRFVAFGDIQLKPFEVGDANLNLTIVPLHLLQWRGALGAFGLAVPLSVLFFMEQNIASAIINSPANKLRKGPAHHWDMLVVSLINLGLSLFGLPWVHAALPYSPLHLRALADVEQHVEIGQHIRQTIVRVRETRLTNIFSHILIGCSLTMIPFPLNCIPTAVLDGLFVCMAVSAVYDNQLFQRILLIFTEQSAYPPSHYIRRVPQRKIHLFTLTQLTQLAALCAVSFAPSPYVKMGFPLLLVGQILIRHTLLPKIIERKYIDALDRTF